MLPDEGVEQCPARVARNVARWQRRQGGARDPSLITFTSRAAGAPELGARGLLMRCVPPGTKSLSASARRRAGRARRDRPVTASPSAAP